MPVITFSLSQASIEAAIDQLKAYRDKVQGLDAKLVKRLAEEGAEIAQSYVPVYTGELMNSIRGEASGREGRVIAYSDYGGYVEFGTGIVGAGEPHPAPWPGWTYDYNNHGEEGWWWPDDSGYYHWTQGQPAKPFMYNTAQELKNKYAEIAAEELRT